MKNFDFVILNIIGEKKTLELLKSFKVVNSNILMRLNDLAFNLMVFKKLKLDKQKYGVVAKYS